MKYSVNENLEDRKGVVSNLHCFMNRHLDTGFKSKWSGFWSPPNKFLDYYAIKVNGVWLDQETVQAAEYGEKMVFHHETDSLRIREEVSAPATIPGIQVSLEFENKMENKKAVHVALEPGVDIRNKSEDVDETEYEMETGPNRVTAARNGKKFMISSDQDFDLRGDSYTKEHYPGEQQKCFIPGQLSFRKEIEDQKKLEIEMTTSDGVFGDLQDIDQSFEGENLARVFKYSVESVKNLIYDKDSTGVIAGHPWFQSFWARDSFWTVLGLIDAGYFELSEDILTNFAKKDLPGKINLEGRDEYDEQPRMDTCPLFVIAADKLERHFRINDVIEEALDGIFEDLEIENGVIQNPPKSTWMDTLDREEALDLQSLWLKAAEILERAEEEELRDGLEEFKEEGYMKDNISENPPETINPAVPLMFGQVEDEMAEEYLQKINGEFSSRYGARTRSMADPGYESSGYHTGSTWGLTTAWAAAANLEYGKEQLGKSFLEKMTQFLDRNQLGALPEVVDSEKGNLMGCSEQAWTAGMTLHVIDSHLLGIRAESPEKVVIDPSGEPNCIRTGKKIGDQELDIRVSDGEVEILNDPDIKVEVRGR
jgi:glycogen debranching enzyme